MAAEYSCEVGPRTYSMSAQLVAYTSIVLMVDSLWHLEAFA